MKKTSQIARGINKTTDSVKMSDEQVKNNLKRQQEVYKNITFAVETITAEDAHKILMENNIDNRKVRAGAVKRYMNDFINNNWMVTCAPIVFDENGVLRDGQHRLIAQFNSGATIMYLVVRGVPEESFVVMDSGAARTSGDAFTIAGISNAGKAANCMSAAMSLLNGKKCVYTSKGDTNMTASGRFGNKALKALEEYRKHEKTAICAIGFAARIKKERSKQYKEVGITEGDIAGTIVYLIDYLGHDKERVYDFFSRLYLTSSATADSQLFKSLRKTLSVNLYDAVRRILPGAVQSYISKAWNLYISGKLKTKVVLTLEEEQNGVKYDLPETKVA